MLIALLLGIIPQTDIITDRVDEIELNHRYDDNGKYYASQAIFWEWRDGARVVMDWRNCHRDLRPRRHGDGCRLTFQENVDRYIQTNGRHSVETETYLRVIDAPVWRETFTQHDPELEDRVRWDLEISVFDAKKNPRTLLSRRPPR